ncbi:MAG: hypothetical protein ABF759_14125 [Acetobacter malorum]|uniref:hypothetical protein n=1 Tax=Acetobacter malorum TaxID=178901 RepID=UPI0039EC8AE3
MIGGLANFVLETATSPGTGAFILNGPETGRRAFSAAFRTGQTVFYFADDGSNAEWGLGTLTIGTPSTLARTTILGTTSGAMQALNFTGTVEVYNEIPAERIPIIDEAGNMTISGTVYAAKGLVADDDPGGQTPGAVTQYYQVGSHAGGRGGAFSLYVQELVGSEFQGVLLLSGNPKSRFLLLSSAGRFTDSVLGDFAYTSDLANYQPKGDYATTQSLSAESQTRASADGTLQTNINNEAATRINADTNLQGNITAEAQARAAADNALNSAKVNRGGDTMYGSLAVNAASGISTVYDPGGQTSGAVTQYARLSSHAGGRGGAFSLYVQELVGSEFQGVLLLDQINGSRFIALSSAGRLTDSLKGDFAYTADLPFTDPNLRVQVFRATGVANGQVVSFPTVFRQAVAVFTQVISDSGGIANHNINEVTNGGFTLHSTGNFDMYVVAYGYF